MVAPLDTIAGGRPGGGPGHAYIPARAPSARRMGGAFEAGRMRMAGIGCATGVEIPGGATARGGTGGVTGHAGCPGPAPAAGRFGGAVVAIAVEVAGIGYRAIMPAPLRAGA